LTVQSLLDQIAKLIEAELANLDALTKANYLARRKEILTGVRDLWDQASITPVKSAEIGNVIYVSKAEAFKYGRMKKLNDLVTEQAKIGAMTDISNLEAGGVKLYTTEYNGYAWAYNQGFGIPLTGGAKVRLVSDALYSNFYGKAFDETVKQNLGKYADDILGTVTRGLNQGYSYAKIAKEITSRTDRAFGNAVLVARTEGGRIQSQAYVDHLLLLDDLGVDYGKMWNSTIDSRTRESHIAMDGKLADKDGVFHLSDPEATGAAPRMTGVAAHDINCRCNPETVINGETPKERRIRGEGIVPYETFTQRLERGGNIPVSKVRSARS